jgi:hypothetical protein
MRVSREIAAPKVSSQNATNFAYSSADGTDLELNADSQCVCEICANSGSAFGLISPGVAAKTLPRNKLGEDYLSKNPQEPNINLVRSAWRRLKKDIQEAIIRDLQPVKDVKGGGGVKSESKPTTGGTSTRRGQ